MTAASKIGSGIYLVDAHYGKRDIAAIYILKHKKQAVIIETGTLHSLPFIKQALTELELGLDDVSYIIPTHVHLDHAAGAGTLMELCQNAELVIHPQGAPHMIDPTKLVKGTMAVYGEEKFLRLYGEIKPVAADRILEAPDQFKLDFNGRKLKFLDTPGHARHHFCIWDKKSKSMFSGDTFGISYREFDTADDIFIFPTTTPVQFEPERLLASIDLIMRHQPKQICLTHYGAINPEDKVVSQLKDGISYMTNIAEEEYESDKPREKIKQRIMNYLLEQLQDMGTYKDEEFCRQKLANDVELNAQGLMVWMVRREKAKPQ